VPATIAAGKSRLVATITRTSARSAEFLRSAQIPAPAARGAGQSGFPPATPDFIEEERPAVSQLEAAQASLQRARECASLMPKQFRGE